MRIDLITLVADDVPRMAAFFRDVLGFAAESIEGPYVEFQSEGVRFAVCSREIMFQATAAEDYHQPLRGQAVELAFPCASPQDVDARYAQVVAGGARPVKAPADMPWGQRAAFFRDPEGNIHELFAALDGNRP